MAGGTSTAIAALSGGGAVPLASIEFIIGMGAGMHGIGMLPLSEMVRCPK